MSNRPILKTFSPNIQPTWYTMAWNASMHMHNIQRIIQGKGYQLATRTITFLLVLFLSNYHYLIPPKQKYECCQSATLSLDTKVCYTLARPCDLARNYLAPCRNMSVPQPQYLHLGTTLLAPWCNCTFSNVIFTFKSLQTQSRINPPLLNKLESLSYWYPWWVYIKLVILINSTIKT